MSNPPHDDNAPQGPQEGTGVSGLSLEDLELSIDFSLRKIRLHHDAMRKHMLESGQQMKDIRDSGIWRNRFPTFNHCLLAFLQKAGDLTVGGVLHAKASLEMADGKEFTDDDLLDLSIRIHFPPEIAEKILTEGDELDD